MKIIREDGTSVGFEIKIAVCEMTSFIRKFEVMLTQHNTLKC